MGEELKSIEGNRGEAKVGQKREQVGVGRGSGEAAQGQTALRLETSQNWRGAGLNRASVPVSGVNTGW